MKSAKNWFAYNFTISLGRTVNRRILIERHMGSADIVILKDVFMQDIMQMLFIENDHVIKAFSA